MAMIESEFLGYKQNRWQKHQRFKFKLIYGYFLTCHLKKKKKINK